MDKKVEEKPNLKIGSNQSGRNTGKLPAIKPKNRYIRPPKWIIYFTTQIIFAQIVSPLKYVTINPKIAQIIPPGIKYDKIQPKRL